MAGAIFASNAAAQTAPAETGAIIGTADSPQTETGEQDREPPSCPYTLAMALPCGEKVPLTIGFRENLGEAATRLQSLVARQSTARIGWPTDIELGLSPYDHDEIVAVDMANPDQVNGYREVYEMLKGISGDIELSDETNAAFATDSLQSLGSVQAPELEARLIALLRELVRIRALEQMSTMAVSRLFSLCLESWDRECPVSGDSNAGDLTPGDEVYLGLRNQGDEAYFVYLLLAGPRLPLRLVAGSDARPLAKGEVLAAQDKALTLASGRYRLFAITSATPIDARVFDAVGQTRDGGAACQTAIGAILCSALSGNNIATANSNELASLGVDIMSKSWDFTLDFSPGAGGGQVAPAGFAPWQVQIFSNQTYSQQQIEQSRAAGLSGDMLHLKQPFQRYHRCAGSLIAPNVVLTAAHCVAKGPTVINGQVLNTREVRVGTQNLKQGGAIYRIDAVVVHAGYRPGSQRDDIALLRIVPKRGAVAQTPIMLPDQVPGMRRVGPRSLMEILGWGYTREVARAERHELADGSPQFVEAQLRIATMEAMDLAKCRKIQGYGDVEKKICATTPSTRTDGQNAFSCRNDSGGPVIQRLNAAGQLVQIGVVSGGVGCGAEENGVQNPSLFVDLQLYTDWINRAKARLSSLGRAVGTLP